MRALLVKEFYWNWRSFRFPALILVFVFFALLNPPTMKYMNEILAYFSDLEGIDQMLPTPNPADTFFSILSDLSQIGILVLIFISMGTVAKEKETGVAGWMLSKPVGRWNYLLAKVLSLYGATIVGLAVASLLGYLYTGSLLGWAPVQGAVWAVIALAVFMCLIASITFACSALLKTPLAAGGVAVVLFFLSGMLNMVIGRSALLRSVYPNTLLAEMGPLLRGISSPVDIVLPLLVTLILSAGVVGLAGQVFSRMDL